jgi:glycosyltransferase involved in cell wall biosynthesis
MSRGKNIAVVYASWDGPLGSITGLGKLSQHFIESFPAAAKKYKQKGVNLSLHVIAINADNETITTSSPGYSESIHKNTAAICRSLNGQLHLMDETTQNDTPQGFYSRWSNISKKTSDLILNYSRQYDEVIVYVVGQPILGRVPYYFNQSARDRDNVKLVVVPHTDFFCYFSPSYLFEYLEWETASFQLVNMYQNTYVAATSKFQIDLLKQHYVLPKSKIIPLQSGVFDGDTRFKPISQAEILRNLELNKIPTDVDLIFSVARAVPQKGFDELLKTFAELIKIHNKPIHLVFIASTALAFTKSSTVEQIKQIISDQNLEHVCTPFFRHDFELPSYMFQWENTKIVAQLALQESFGLVPEEARISPNNAGPVVVASNLGGFKEQITNGKDGFLVDPKDHVQTAKIMSKILNMSEPELAKIRKAGRARVKRDYDYTKNVIESLERLVE